MPIVASPMDTVCSPELVELLALKGMVGFLHRNMTYSEKVKAIQDFTFKYRPKSSLERYEKYDYINYGIAVTTALENVEDLLRFQLQHDLDNQFPALRIWLCIDTANGFHQNTEDAILRLREMELYKKFEHKIILVVGNVASKEGYKFLAQFPEVDAIRVGISNGSPCTTGLVTGMGQGIVSSILECASVRSYPKIIADGSVKHTGDIIKAIALGADLVMAGSMFAGFAESAGKLIKPKKKFLFFKWDNKDSETWTKEFRGMASYGAAQESQRVSGITKAILPEGEATAIKYKGKVTPFLESLKSALGSAMSYQNAHELLNLRNNIIATDAISQQTYFSHMERGPFIKYAAK